jgi:uncharacterized protein (DUF58 family)
MWWKKNKAADESAIQTPQSELLKTPHSAYHNPNSFLDPEVLARVSSLEILARTVVEGFISGLHRSPFTGFSTEFAEYRQYMPGDDLRYLDWKLLGRTDRYYIKKYRADTNTQFHLLVDASGSTKYASGGVTKLHYAKMLAASLAYLVNKQNDAVGMIAFDSAVRVQVPSQNRTGHLRSIFGHLEQLQPSAPGVLTKLPEMLHEVAERITKRSVVIIISDFYGYGFDDEAIIEAMQHLSFKGNNVIAFKILDSNEIEFNFDEPVILVDCETEEELYVRPEEVAEGYRETFQQHLTRVREGAINNRVEFELLTTNKPLDYALFSFLSKRAG